MYTPITKRVKVAQHKSSIAKLTEDEKKKTETAQTANKQGDLQNTTGIVNPGEDQVTASTERCGVEVPMSDPRCKEFSKMSQEEIEASEIKQGLRKKGDPSANFESKPVVQDAEAASRIDLFSSPEGRASFRTGQSQGRFVRKTARQSARAQDQLAKFLEKNDGLVPEPGGKGYRKYQKLLTASETFKSQNEGAENRLKNYRQMTDGMRNRYLSQTMDYDRDLTKGKDAGPVKAPEGTQTEEEFKSNFKKELGINGGSSNPQTTTTPTTSFAEMATTAFKPIKLGGDALFTGNLFDKGQKKSAAFKMKGYRSNR